MKPLCIWSIVAILSLHAAVLLSAPFSHERFKALVGSNYLAATKAYNDMLDWMLSTVKDFDPEITEPKEIGQDVMKARDDFVKHLDVASRNAEDMSKEVETEMEQYSAKVSALEAKIRNQNKQIESNRVNVQNKQQQLNLATQSLQTSQANLQTHRNALAEAEKKEKKAKYKCVRRRRRKRGLLSKVWKEIKRPIKKARKELKRAEKKVRKGIKGAICKTLNVFTHHIDKAKKDVKNAEHGVHVAQQSQAKAEAEKNAAVQQLATTQAEGNRLQQEKGKIVAALATAKQKRDKLINISVKIKNTVKHINQLKAPGEVLKFSFELGYLLDAGVVIAPLKAIGSDVATLNGSPSDSHFLPKLSTDQALDLRQKLITLSEKGAMSAEVPDDEEETELEGDSGVSVKGVETEDKHVGEEADIDSDIVDTNVALAAGDEQHTSGAGTASKANGSSRATGGTNGETKAKGSETTVSEDYEDDDIIDTNI